METNSTPGGGNLRRIGCLSLGHMVNDAYMNQMQVLLPYFVLTGISVSRGAFLVSAFTLTSSLVQPFFGLLGEGWGAMVYTGTLWMALLLGLVGRVGSYPALLLVVALAGFGTAAFHPKASALVAASAGKNKSFAQAIFIAAGNAGWALTPLFAAPLVEHFGLRVTPWFILPGALMSFFLWYTMHSLRPPARARAATPEGSAWQALKAGSGELGRIMSVVALRSLTYFGLIAFIPLYLQQRNVPLLTGSRAVFLMLLTGSLGGLLGGFLADRWGGKAVIVGSLLAAPPLLLGALIATGWARYFCLGLGGAFLLASFSVTVTAAHSVLKQNAGLASGIMLGFGTGIGGLGVGLLGVFAEKAGLAPTVCLLGCLPLAAGLVGLFMRATPAR